MVPYRSLSPDPSAQSAVRVHVTVYRPHRGPFASYGVVRDLFSTAFPQRISNLMFEPVLESSELIYAAAATGAVGEVLELIVGASKGHSLRTCNPRSLQNGTHFSLRGKNVLSAILASSESHILIVKIFANCLSEPSPKGM